MNVPKQSLVKTTVPKQEFGNEDKISLTFG